jgi:hypothetical protein
VTYFRELSRHFSRGREKSQCISRSVYPVSQLTFAVSPCQLQVHSNAAAQTGSLTVRILKIYNCLRIQVFWDLTLCRFCVLSDVSKECIALIFKGRAVRVSCYPIPASLITWTLYLTLTYSVGALILFLILMLISVKFLLTAEGHVLIYCATFTSVKLITKWSSLRGLSRRMIRSE